MEVRSKNGGSDMSIWKRIKKSINHYLESMAEENKKSFGNGRLDCCQLNKKQDHKHQ
jgi:hypothetical protein